MKNIVFVKNFRAHVIHLKSNLETLIKFIFNYVLIKIFKLIYLFKIENVSEESI